MTPDTDALVERVRRFALPWEHHRNCGIYTQDGLTQGPCTCGRDEWPAALTTLADRVKELEGRAWDRMAAKENKRLQARIEELDAMLVASEEHTQHWEAEVARLRVMLDAVLPEKTTFHVVPPSALTEEGE